MLALHIITIELMHGRAFDDIPNLAIASVWIKRNLTRNSNKVSFGGEAGFV